MARTPVEPLLSTGEVAEMFNVDPKTVTRWAARGQLEALRTPGGHRRFRMAEIERKLALYRAGLRLPRPTQPADAPRAPVDGSAPYSFNGAGEDAQGRP